MDAVNPPVVLCVYPIREHAEHFAALLREHGISVVAVPSDRHLGEWDVLVTARDVSRAAKIIRNLLEPD